MSLLSTETLHVFYAPDSVLALSRSGLSRRMGQARAYAVDSTDVAPWQRPLAMFSQALAQFRIRRVRVVLSHHFVQFRVLPWRADLGADAEHAALAKLEFSTAFGALADSWTVALSDERPGQPKVAAALPSELLPALATAASDAGAKLATVQSCLAVAARDWTRGLNWSDCSWLVVQEPGRLCVAVRQANSWAWVRHIRIAGDWSEKLAEIMAAESLLSGLPMTPPKVHVFAPGVPAPVMQTLRDGGFLLLAPAQEQGFQLERDGAYAPAWMV